MEDTSGDRTAVWPEDRGIAMGGPRRGAAGGFRENAAGPFFRGGGVCAGGPSEDCRSGGREDGVLARAPEREELISHSTFLVEIASIRCNKSSTQGYHATNNQV